jgi:hypothetical protein
MNKLTIFRDFLLGGLLTGFFSYITSLYDETPYLLKIVAFLWAVPLIYFYLLFIAWKGGDNAAKDFTIHALLGIFVTIFAMIMTLYIYKLGRTPVVIINLALLITAIVFYIQNKIYLL